MPTRLSPLIAAVLAILFSSFASLASAQTTVDQYNSQGQPSGSFETQGIVTGFTYDSGINGLDIASEDNGVSSLTQYDSNGNPIQSTTTPQPLGPLIYDSQNGNVVGVGPGRGNVTLYNYDQRQRQTMTEQILLPNNGGVSNGTFAPNINDVIIGSPSRLGITTEYQYDSNFQLQGQFNVMGDATSIAYDPDTQDYFVATDVAGTEELAVYDQNGHFVESMDSIDGIPLNNGRGPNGFAVGDFAGGSELDFLIADQNGNNGSVLLPNVPVSNVLNDVLTVNSTHIAQYGLLSVNPNTGAIFIAVTPESSSIWLFAPSLALLAMVWAAGARRKKKTA